MSQLARLLVSSESFCAPPRCVLLIIAERRLSRLEGQYLVHPHSPPDTYTPD